MEYFDKSKICREFLKQYSEALFPELLPKLMKVAIYSLYKAYHKWTISLQEIDEFIKVYKPRMVVYIVPTNALADELLAEDTKAEYKAMIKLREDYGLTFNDDAVKNQYEIAKNNWLYGKDE